MKILRVCNLYLVESIPIIEVTLKMLQDLEPPKRFELLTNDYKSFVLPIETIAAKW